MRLGSAMEGAIDIRTLTSKVTQAELLITASHGTALGLVGGLRQRS